MGGGGADYAHSGTVVNAMGEVLITGGTKSFGGSDYDSWVVKTDSIGNVLWQQTYNHLSPNGGDGGSQIAQLQDGNYVVAGSYDNPSLTASWGYLMKIDPDGTEIWTKRYENQLSQGFWACEELDDGNILAVGQSSNTNVGSVAGWLVKTDADGDTLWTRTFNPEGAEGILRNMLVMPNGDIVMVGFGFGPNSTTQDGWILRVDSMGCEVENCHLVGVEESSTKENGFSVYPNPVNDLLNIETKHGRIKQVDIYNAFGALVHSETGSAQQKRIEVSGFVAGVYLLMVETDQGVSSTKLVLE